MRCRDIDKLSTAYIDGELDDVRSRAIRGHLHQCEACRERVAAEAQLRDAAEQLAPVDPPAHLWRDIEYALARAEMADAERPRVWLWWQRARQHLLPAAVVCTAAVLAVAWWSKRDRDVFEDDVVAAERAPAVTVAKHPPLKTAVVNKKPMHTQSFTEQRIEQIDRADARYVAVINELKQVIAKERKRWSPATAKRFDTKLAALEKRAQAHRTQVGPPESHPAHRDELYAVYRAEIDLLQRASFGEVPR